VIGTTSPSTVDLVRALGADEVLVANHGNEAAGADPVDLVFDTVGGERLERSPATLRQGGRLVSVA
jgi:NADPH:quinone reductase-like Zn-dependent oxidoreductase